MQTRDRDDFKCSLQNIISQRGISVEKLTSALEAAIKSAAKSVHQTEVEVKIDLKSGVTKVYAQLEVVAEKPGHSQIALEKAREKFPAVQVGDIVEMEMMPKEFGRIAAQVAKQTIMQQLRQAEKDSVQQAFADKVGQIITGTVLRFESGNTIFSFSQSEGIMPTRERVRSEQYNIGDTVSVYLKEINTQTSGPSLIVSRACTEFVAALFEREVSEIHDNLVEVMGISRDPGSRTKIAVRSSDPRIDPVGACVGVRGARVHNISQELNGERIDIVPWDEDIRQYAVNAIQPARIQSVEVNEEKHALVLHVTEEQSRLAFGKRAQNVKLCAKLLGWSVSILTEGGLEEQITRAALALGEALGVTTKTADKLVRAGFVSLEGVREADRDFLADIEGIDAEELCAALDRLPQE